MRFSPNFYPRDRCRVAVGACAAVLSLAALTCAAQAADAPIRIARKGSILAVSAGPQPIFEYQCEPSPKKPFVRKLYSPAGVQVLRDAPADHLHHHALMFALAADAVDFWAEGQESGLQRQKSLAIIEGNPGKSPARAGLRQDIEWIEPGTDKALLEERRTVLALAGPGGPATLLSWRSQLQVPSGKGATKLTGSHYFGLGLRFVESMDQGGRFYNSEGAEGEIVRGSERLTPARWMAYAASAEGRRITVAVFDHPGNLRHPSRMFTMAPPFAYLAATLNLWKEPWELNASRTLDLRYGVAVWDNETDPSGIESLYRQWVKLAAAGMDR
jgi:hypothetical protein